MGFYEWWAAGLEGPLTATRKGKCHKFPVRVNPFLDAFRVIPVLLHVKHNFWYLLTLKAHRASGYGLSVRNRVRVFNS
jgi:hypothetical protein